MRAEEEVLPMVLSRSGPTAPEDLRAVVRPEVARREKTMVLVRDTFRRYALRWCYLAGYQTWTREVYIHTRVLSWLDHDQHVH